MYSIELEGSPSKMGLAHGETFRSQIKEITEIRKELIFGYLKKMSRDEVLSLAEEQVGFLKENHPTSFQEFEGIAQGAQLSLIDAMILNNYTDMRDFSHPETDRDEGCSLFSVKSDENNICGQTWDMHASATPYILRMHLKETDTHVLTVVGCMGLAGVSRKKMAVFINNMHCKETHIGLMWPALVRLMIQKESASSAFEALQSNLPCSGHNYQLCDPKESLNVETTGKRLETTHRSTSGVTFHTNHYVGELKQYEILSRQSKSTFKRYEALENYFANQDIKTLDRQKLTQDILAGKATPAVCIGKPDTPHAAMTCGGIVVDLNSGEGQIFAGAYSDEDHFNFQLS